MFPILKISQFCETKPRSPFASIIEEALPKSKRNRGKSVNFRESTLPVLTALGKADIM